MKVIFKSIEIQNFKGFKSYSTGFDPVSTSFYGKNGSGKTSIADAISWCLFGKDTQNRSQFDIKHHTDDEKQATKTEVSVTLEITADGIDHTIKRMLKEKWQTKRGETTEEFKGNYTEYFINGNLSSQGEFSTFIKNLIDENVFRAVSNPYFFTSLPWKEQRAFLSEMVGNITNEEIADNDERFADLLKALTQEDITAYLKHKGFKINEIKKEIDKIPVRIAELKKARPELDENDFATDWKTKSESLKTDVVKLSEEIAQLKSGNTSAATKEIERKLSFAQKRKREMETSADNKLKAMKEEYHNFCEEIDLQRRKLQESILRNQGIITTKQTVISRAEAELTNFDNSMKALRDRWNKEVNIKLTLPPLTDEDIYCPTCGQVLPTGMIEEARNIRFESMERKRLDTKQRLTEECNKIRGEQEKTKALIASTKIDKEEYEKLLEEDNEKLSSLSKKEYPKVTTYEEILAANPNYKPVLDEITLLERQLESNVPEDNSALIEEKTNQLASLNEQLTITSGKASDIDYYNKVQSLINDAEKDHKALAEQLAALQREEDLAREFADKADNILEEKVNKHFKIVKWKMFKQMINGNKESYCECYVDNIAYHDGLNTAKRLNAGLDICNTLCSLYDAYAPIIIDNAESNLNILHTESQQIRFYVADSELLIK